MQFNWQDLLTALGLLFIIEGLMPFLNPSGLKSLYKMINETPENTLRLFGLGSIVVGLILLYLT